MTAPKVGRTRLTVQVLNGATGEVRELVANVAVDTEHDAANALFAKARTDDYYYRFLGHASVINPSSRHRIRVQRHDLLGQRVDWREGGNHMDQNGHSNRGWRINRVHPQQIALRVSDGSEYREGELLRRCTNCPKFIPFGISFHYEECPGNQ